jgi:hypothetical protein
MPTLQEILQDQNYLNANPATKKAIFDRWSVSDTNYTGANPATQQAIRGRFGVGSVEIPEPVEPPKDKGFFSNIGSLLVEGGKRAIGSAQVSPSVIAGDVGEDKAKLLSEQLSMKPSVQPKQLVEAQTAFKDEAEAFEKAKGFTESIGPFAGFLLEFGKQVITNPKGAAYLTAQSAANMAPQIAGMIAGGKGGAMAGSLAGPGGAAIGATAGAIGGGFAAGTPLEIGSEFISRIGQELSSRGLEPTEANVALLLRDKGTVEQAISDARTKGVTTAAVDSLMTVGAGRFATGARRSAIEAARKEMGATADAAKIAARADELLKARTLGQKVARGAGAVGIETAGGGISEAAGQGAAYGKVNLEDVGAEMLGELGGSALSVPAAAYSTTQDMLRAKAKKDAAEIIADETAAKQQPTPPSPTQAIEEQAAELERQQQRQTAAMERARAGGIGGGSEVNQTLLDQARIRKEQQERAAAAQEKAAEAERQKELRAERARIDSTQYSSDPMMNEVMRSRAVSAFDANQSQADVGATGVTIPEDDNYALLTQAKERLRKQDTPEAKKMMARIDERLNSIVLQDVERISKEAEATKTAEAELKRQQDIDRKKAEGSVFGQEALPEMESRDVIFGNEALADLQAPTLPTQELTPEEIKALNKEKRSTLGKPYKTPEEERLEQAEMDRRKFARSKESKSGTLMDALKGKLSIDAVSDIGGRRGRGYESLVAPKGKAGSSLEDLVDSGELDSFLPPDERVGMSNFDSQNASNKLRDILSADKQTPIFDVQVARRGQDDAIAALESDVAAVKEPAVVQAEVSEVEPGEAATVERAAGDQAVVETTDQIRYKRATGKVGIGKQAVQDTVDTVKARWANAPEVVVAENMDDAAIPQEVRDHNAAAVAKGAKGSPQGFFYKGKAYVIADSIGSTNEAVEALMHESLGHYGLRGTFGPKMEEVLRDVIKQRRAEVEAKAKEYGLDPKSDKDMLEAAEEVLAVMAQTKPGLPFVKRAIAVIRNFLRDLGFNIKMTDADIIEKYILPARAFVESGKGRPTEGAPAASRETGKSGSVMFDQKEIEKNLTPEYKSRTKLIEMSIDDFLGLSDEGVTGYKTEGVSKLIKGGEKFSSLPFLIVDNEGGVEGHEGRHRARALKQAGYTTMPVILRSSNIRWSEQYSPDRFDYVEKWPSKMRAEKNAANPSFSIDFPVKREDSDKAYEAGVVDNIGTYDPNNADIRYQREEEPEAGQPNPTRQNIFGEPVLGTWSITVDPKMEIQDGLIYKMLDKNVDVKRIVEAVKSTGKEIASKWNPYLQEELYHGRTANASQEFQDKEWLPLLKDMDKKGVTIGELEKYLLNRHAEAYNKHVAKVNPTRPEMQDGGSSVKTEDARKYLADLDKDTKAKYEELAKRIDSITKGTRQLLVDTGYEKAETIKGWEKAFPTYVPLMREEADFDYNFGSFGTGRGFDVRRNFSRSAMGSKRNVVDIIGNVISARNNAIALTEKNRVAQAVYGLALEAPNPDFWMAINPEAEKIPQDAIDELTALGLDEDAVNYLMKEPKQRVLDPKKNQIVSRINTKLRENDYVLATRINGEKRYVFFNPKDPRANRAATALKNLDAQDLGVTLGMIAKVTRWMASVNTQYNPIFGPYNFLRDVQSAALQLSTTELAGQQKEVAANVVPSLKVIYSSLRKRRKGEAATGELADLWKEFQKEGGQTGFRDNFSRTQDRTEALLNEMSKITEGKVKAGARSIVDWLSDYNDSLENAVRLSAYVVARDKFIKKGMSPEEAKQKAASLAKNLTVNFNRKGDVATQMGALYAFFNASMQGSARMVETLKGPMGKKIMAGGLLLGSMQAALLAAAGFDDEEPPEFIRSKNILIPTGNGNYVAFPMALGFHVIPGISRILTEWAMSGFKDTARRVTDLTGLFLDAFNPVGNAGWSVQTITPTILDPLVALGENKDFTGKPISKEDMFFLNPTPGYSRAREGANFLTTALAEFLNAASGGDKDRQGVISPTPEQIEYLIGQATGGVGREFVKLTTTIDKTITGEELPPYKIPLYGRFVGETKSAAAESNKFYKNMKELNELNNVVTGRRERKEPLGDFMRENPEARLLPLANKTFKDVQELRKRRKALLERGAPKESIQAVEKLITRRMQVLNDRVKAMEQ